MAYADSCEIYRLSVQQRVKNINMYYEDGYGVAGIQYTLSDGTVKTFGDLSSNESQYMKFSETVELVGFDGVVWVG